MLEAANATINIPAFTPGTTAAVLVVATKLDPARRSRVQLEVTDVAGNVTQCDPVLATLRIPEAGGAVRKQFGNIPVQERFLTIQNGAPGLTSLRVRVNGSLYELVALAPDEVRTLDLGSRMRAGANTVVLKGWGAPGASALVLLSDGVADHPHKRWSAPAAAGRGIPGQDLTWGPGVDW